MTTAASLLTWARREPPLTTVAVAATGAAATSLRIGVADRLQRGNQLRVTAGADWIVVFGHDEDLPWADGAIYLGWDSGLLLPTTLRPSVPTALLRAAYESAQLVVALPGHVLLSDLPQRTADPARLVADGSNGHG